MNPTQIKVGAEVTGAIGVGLATFMGYLPIILGSLLSLAGIAWIGIQAYYFIKEKKKSGL